MSLFHGSVDEDALLYSTFPSIRFTVSVFLGSRYIKITISVSTLVPYHITNLLRGFSLLENWSLVNICKIFGSRSIKVC